MKIIDAYKRQRARVAAAAKQRKVAQKRLTNKHFCDGITERPADYYTLSYAEQKRIYKALKKTATDPGYWDRPVHVIETPGGLTMLYDDDNIQDLIAPYLEHGYTVSITTKTLGGKVLTFTKG